MTRPLKILFLCTGNACRSQMAEGFARYYGGADFEIHSAGTHPAGLHPMTVEMMKERGIDVSSHRSKGLDAIPRDIDVVVTVCDQARETCPIFPGVKTQRHWSLRDPVSARGSEEEAKAVFRAVRDEIERRVRELLIELRTTDERR